MRYVAALLVGTLGLFVLRSKPGPIIPYLRERAKNTEDFASGLAIAMAVRWAMGVLMIVLAIRLALGRF